MGVDPERLRLLLLIRQQKAIIQGLCVQVAFWKYRLSKIEEIAVEVSWLEEIPVSAPDGD